jgi:glycosyltransferase involved in cell wall biosynthesis
MELAAPVAVSVVIPCYGQAHFLDQAIDSVLAQTRVSEIVVVDDGSPDNASEVARRYSMVRYLRQENKGLAEARNAGFRETHGDYVIFLDADDCLTPNAVEAHLRCFGENAGAGFVVGDIDHMAEDGSPIESPRWPLLRENFYEELLKVNHVANTIAVMFRREVIASIGGFDTSCSPAEDYRLLLAAARLFPSAHHRTVVARYRRHPAGLSRRGVAMLRAMARIMELERPLVQGQPRLERAHRRGVRYWRDHFGRVAMKELYHHIRRGRIFHAGRALAGLLRYSRGRVVVIPWIYRKKAFLLIRRRLGLAHTKANGWESSSVNS